MDPFDIMFQAKSGHLNAVLGFVTSCCVLELLQDIFRSWRKTNSFLVYSDDFYLFTFVRQFRVTMWYN